MAPLVTLTSDFGTRDSYVAQMKAVLCHEGPSDLRIVDLSHEIAPFDIYEAALFVRTALPRFPPGTVHVVVVDPGVGSARQALVARAAGQVLVGPDNGVFGYLFDGSEDVHVIDPQRLGPRALSSTFHGRDLFAPAAARVLCGADPSSLGPPAETHQHKVFPLVEVSCDTLTGRVIHVDRYGNLITNIAESTLRAFMAGSEGQGGPLVQVASRTVRGLVTHYEQAERGKLIALIGSGALVEVAMRECHAANELGATVGMPVRVRHS